MGNAILQELQEIKQLLALQKRVLNLNEFCTYTGISKAYAYHLTSTGKVKFYRPFGKMIYFDVEDVVEFLKQNAAETSNVKSKANKYFIEQLNK
ncbi:helix-turn-helix transcriptional regulator [Longitalea luteola]|uniref:helix-turn-helix transcriptional regulator n=1 Tax=Longitalea luteola TaxID=2812563 RepID=UPI001A95BBBC|nr:helix-turn-helix domain-containing protein [Longitalea luteola]